MEKLKSSLKSALIFVGKGTVFRYVLVLLILASIPSAVLLQKWYENSSYKSEEIKKDSAISNDISGTIATDVESNIENESRSTYTLDDGFEEYVEETSSINSNFNNNPSDDVVSVDKSSLLGEDLIILEGESFNVNKDLKLKAIDRDGSDITNRISIERNDVNTAKPGNYKVKAYVKLSDGSILQKEFLVTVKEATLDVSIKDFVADKTNVEKGENIQFNLDMNLSKKHISPVSAMINGIEYPVYKTKQGILKNKITYKVNVKAEETSGKKNYNMSYIKMSDNTIISTNNTAMVEVLKDEAKIKNFTYAEETIQRRIKAKFNIEDKDNSSSNMRVEVYRGNELIKTKELEKQQEDYNLYLDTEYNGKYKIKFIADINRTVDALDEDNKYNAVIFEETVNISKIDKPTITGKSIEIMQGDSFDPIRDLSIKAYDEDGNDIADKVVFDTDLDTNLVGNYNVKATVKGKNGREYSVNFTVEVKPSTSNYVEENEVDLVSYYEKDNYSRELRVGSSIRDTVNGFESETLTSSVNMAGMVNKADGTAANGKIQVELPTSMSFTVDKNGTFIAANGYFIKNRSSVPVEVSVKQFTETNNSGGITVKAETESLSALDRSNIHLSLLAGTKKIDLGGSLSNEPLLATIEPNGSTFIQLVGDAGKDAGKDVDDNGVNEEFSVVFKIKKKN